MLNHIPLEILTEILCRLDTQTLLRCRAVSKQWCSLIDGYHFIITHLNHSIKTNTDIRAFLQDESDHVYDIGGAGILYQAGDGSVYPGHHLTLQGRQISKFLGSCHGLLCLWDSSGGIFIYNPSTRKHKCVPSFAPFLPTDLVESVQLIPGEVWASGNGYGFGYDAVSDDYKIVMLTELTGPGQIWGEIEMTIYCTRKDLYRIMQIPYRVCSLKNTTQNMGFYIGGALHWIGCRVENIFYPNIIIGFDLGVDEFREISQPDDVSSVFIGELSGCLCLLAKIVDEAYDVWVMKEYGVKESWNKVFSIPGSILRYRTLYFSITPLGYSKDGGAVLFEMDSRLVLYHIEEKRPVDLEIDVVGDTDEYQAIFCFSSLVSPN